jgi:hypothetical protein
MSSPSQCRSASQHPTAAIRGNAPTSDPSWSASARYGRRRMFQQRRPHLETISPPACGVGAASPLIAARSSPLHRSLSSPHVSLCGRVRRARKSRVCRQQHVNWETDSWVRVRLTASGTRDGRYAAARLGPAVDRCWRRRHSLEGASTSWLHSRDAAMPSAFHGNRPYSTSIFRPGSGAAANTNKEMSDSSCSSCQP